MRRSADNEDGTSDFAWCKSVVKERLDRLTTAAERDAKRARMRVELLREQAAAGDPYMDDL